jgi:hypothetical protein
MEEKAHKDPFFTLISGQLIDILIFHNTVALKQEFSSPREPHVSQQCGIKIYDSDECSSLSIHFLFCDNKYYNL